MKALAKINGKEVWFSINTDLVAPRGVTQEAHLLTNLETKEVIIIFPCVIQIYERTITIDGRNTKTGKQESFFFIELSPEQI